LTVTDFTIGSPTAMMTPYNRLMASADETSKQQRYQGKEIHLCILTGVVVPGSNGCAEKKILNEKKYRHA